MKNVETTEEKLNKLLKEKGFSRLLEEPSISASHSGGDLTYKQLFMLFAKSLEPISFEEAARPLMKYLSENHHPMTTSIIDGTNAQIYEGVECFNTDEYIID